MALESDIEFGEIDFGLVLVLGAVGLVAYLIYRGYQAASNRTNCGPSGGQKCCDSSQVNTDACVGSDGNPCGWWEYLTATSCYQGAPTNATAEQIAQSRAQSSVPSGIGSLFSPNIYSNPTPGVTSPGLPVGYNPQTGTINTSTPGVGTLAPGTTPNSQDPNCISGMPYDVSGNPCASPVPAPSTAPVLSPVDYLQPYLF